MSDDIPFEIQEEIIKRLPVKSLIRFRSVSKQWKYLIDSSQFIIDHSVKLRHLLVKFSLDAEDNYLSIVDGSSFPHHNFSPTVSLIVEQVTSPSLLDCSHGLVCLYGYYQDLLDDNKLIVLWNPSIRKSVGIMVPDGLTAVGVGVCHKTSDPKIVKFIGPSTVDLKAEVFTLSTGTWRSVSVKNLCMSFESIEFDCAQVVIDGVIYWLATSETSDDALIISFDLTSEEFEQVELPERLACPENKYISKFKDSLAVICYNEDYSGCDVWIKNNGDSFTILFKLDFKTFDNSRFYNIVGFRMNGHVIMEHYEGRRGRLKVYEPCSKHVNDLEIDAVVDDLGMQMASYTESLLLLNHSASIIH